MTCSFATLNLMLPARCLSKIGLILSPLSLCWDRLVLSLLSYFCLYVFHCSWWLWTYLNIISEHSVRLMILCKQLMWMRGEDIWLTNDKCMRTLHLDMYSYQTERWYGESKRDGERERKKTVELLSSLWNLCSGLHMNLWGCWLVGCQCMIQTVQLQNNRQLESCGTRKRERWEWSWRINFFLIDSEVWLTINRVEKSQSFKIQTASDSVKK